KDVFPMCDCSVQGVHLRTADGHRVGDDVGSRWHCGSQVRWSVGVECINAYGGHPSRSAPSVQEVDKPSARLVSTCRRRKVLEIDDQHIGFAALHSFVRMSVGSGTKEPGASKVGIDEWHRKGLPEIVRMT